ncbi:hypothetical protein LCGC14_2033990 [marine sediment metagenome]|uniref:Uncharacterized protein n=1 Tax=marine sediment metagenome TaxID=412755 RepID=A0A0F9FGE9_9ZZZZ
MVFGIPGTDNFMSSIGWAKFTTGVGLFFLTIFLFILVGGVLFWWLNRKYDRKVDIHNIVWWEEIGEHMQLYGQSDKARELTIPGTNVKVFYIKARKMYLPRFTIKVGERTYFVGIRKNREIVNWRPKNLNKDMIESGLDYDHRDMRYASTNLKAMVDRNYRQKALPWYLEHKELIGVLILIIVVSGSFWFLFGKVEELLTLAGQILENAGVILNEANGMRNSGVVQV